MDINACSTRLVLHWMRQSCNKTVSDDKSAFFVDRVRFALNYFTLTFDAPPIGFTIALDGQPSLSVNGAFSVCNLGQVVQGVHTQVELAWKSQWDSMVQTPWSAQVLPLDSVVHFAITVERVRRQQNKTPWRKGSANLLEKLQNGLMDFLAYALELSISQKGHLFLGKPIPCREFSRQSMYIFVFNRLLFLRVLWLRCEYGKSETLKAS